tara:strand:+ start:6114 stop:7022 length:909 start_codon:yes stop_codon:yes gene_type:complete
MKNVLDKLTKEEIKQLSEKLSEVNTKYYGNPLKKHKQEKLMADLFQVKDYNTLMGIARIDYKEEGFSNLKKVIEEYRSGKLKNNHCLFMGRIGVGKSSSARAFLGAITLNKDYDITIIDLFKGAMHYRDLKGDFRIIGHGKEERIKEILLGLEKELNNLDNSKKRDRFIVIEEFHGFMNFLSKDENLYNIFINTLKEGKRLGLTIAAVTQRGTPDDIPEEVVDLLYNKFIFKCTKTEFNYLIGSEKAYKIDPREKGLAINQKGEIVYFPFSKKTKDEIPEDLKEKLLKNKVFRADKGYFEDS